MRFASSAPTCTLARTPSAPNPKMYKSRRQPHVTFYLELDKTDTLSAVSGLRGHHVNRLIKIVAYALTLSTDPRVCTSATGKAWRRMAVKQG